MRRKIFYLLAVEMNFTFGDFFKARNHTQKSRLATARRAQQSKKLVITNTQRNAPNRHEITRSVSQR